MPKNATNEKNKFSENKIFSKIYKGKIFQKFTGQFHSARRTIFLQKYFNIKSIKKGKVGKTQK